MLLRQILVLGLLVSDSVFADGNTTEILSRCSAKSLKAVSTTNTWINMNNSAIVTKEARFEIRQIILSKKMECVYEMVIAQIGGDQVTVNEALTSGKFKAANDALKIARAEIMKDGLSGDDLQRADNQFTIDAINEVTLPSMLPMPSPRTTMGQLRDGHVNLIRTAQPKK